MNDLDDASPITEEVPEEPITTKRGKFAGEDIALFLAILAMLAAFFGGLAISRQSDATALILLLCGFVGFIAFVALLRLFRISRTLEDIRDILNDRR